MSNNPSSSALETKDWSPWTSMTKAQNVASHLGFAVSLVVGISTVVNYYIDHSIGPLSAYVASIILLGIAFKPLGEDGKFRTWSWPLSRDGIAVYIWVGVMMAGYGVLVLGIWPLVRYVAVTGLLESGYGEAIGGAFLLAIILLLLCGLPIWKRLGSDRAVAYELLIMCSMLAVGIIGAASYFKHTWLIAFAPFCFLPLFILGSMGRDRNIYPTSWAWLISLVHR